MHTESYPTQPTTPVPTVPAPEPALHLLGGIWIASCLTCGYQLASARTQERCERRAGAGSARSATWTPPDAGNDPACLGALPGMDDNALGEQIARLRQLIARLRELAVTDPEVSVVDLAIIKALEELAEALQERRGNDPTRGLGST